jgi:hypothetical protein
MRWHIPKEYKEIALRMTQRNVSDRTIRRYTGISGRSMRYLRKTYRETGEVVRTPVCPGRPHTLDSLEANVNYLLYSLIHL